jgi:hypothetical protein
MSTGKNCMSVCVGGGGHEFRGGFLTPTPLSPYKHLVRDCQMVIRKIPKYKPLVMSGKSLLKSQSHFSSSTFISGFVFSPKKIWSQKWKRVKKIGDILATTIVANV